ncbi:MAG: addiction module protein [Lentisphaeria bacterium]
MNTTAEKVVADALGLPPALRAFVAEKLIESLDEPDSAPLSAKWRQELRRRCAEVDRGAVELRDANAVFANAYGSLD